jgi:metal-responsive CopG/Arc/MetJ family transcriptional regulator
MSIGTAKVAISIPKEIFRLLERTRRELKIPRSAAVVEALRAWLKSREEEKMVHQYVEGYRRHPERISSEEAKARLKITAQAFHKEEPWR